MFLILMAVVEEIHIYELKEFPPSEPVNIAITVEDRRMEADARFLRGIFFVIDPESSVMFIEDSLMPLLFNSGDFLNVLPLNQEMKQLLKEDPELGLKVLSANNIEYLIIVSIEKYRLKGKLELVFRYEVIETNTGMPVKSGFYSAKFQMGEYESMFGEPKTFLKKAKPHNEIFYSLLLKGRKGDIYYDLLSDFKGRSITKTSHIKNTSCCMLSGIGITLLLAPVLSGDSTSYSVNKNIVFLYYPFESLIYASSIEHYESQDYRFTGLFAGGIAGWFISAGMGWGKEGLTASILFGSVAGFLLGRSIKNRHPLTRRTESIKNQGLKHWSF